jgi:hypothetical protein
VNNDQFGPASDRITITNLHIHDIYPEVDEASEGANPTTYKGTAIAIRGGGALGQLVTNIRVEDCTIERTGYKAIEMSRASVVEVLNNTMRDIGGPAIQPGRSSDLVIRGNVVDKSGSLMDPRMHGRGSGIWPWTCERVLIERNTFMHARGRADSCGIHIDFNCSDVVVQYNLSIDNAGGFMEILGNNDNCTYRYNISINDGGRVKGVIDQGTIANNQDGHILWVSGFVGSGNPYNGPFNSYVYNNTVYVRSDIRSTWSIGEWTDGLLIANNIFYVEGDSVDITGDFANDYTQAMADRVVWHNNLYQRTGVVPTFNLDLFTDTNQIIGNPLFANTGGTNAVDYIPSSGTFVQDQGVVITNIPGDPLGLLAGLTVTQDFFGNPISGLPDMGAVEMTGPPAVTLVLVGGSIRNGDFNANPGASVTFADTPEWYNLGGAQTVQCTRDNLTYDGSQNTVLAAARDVGIDSGHTLAEGDVFDISYVWRDAFEWLDPTDNVRITLFVTDDDTLTGTRTDVAVDLSGISTVDSTYEAVVRSGVYTATATSAGKRLFAMIDCDSAGFARVDNFQLSVTPALAPPSGYQVWSTGYGLDEDELGDDDYDTLINLYEYGLGGNPTNGIVDGNIPSVRLTGGGLEYVYAQRTDDPNLVYYLELSDDPVSGVWTNSGYTVVGTNVTEGTFDFVTNAVPTDKSQKFIRLIIGNESGNPR